MLHQASCTVVRSMGRSQELRAGGRVLTKMLTGRAAPGKAGANESIAPKQGVVCYCRPRPCFYPIRLRLTSPLPSYCTLSFFHLHSNASYSMNETSTTTAASALVQPSHADKEKSASVHSVPASPGTTTAADAVAEPELEGYLPGARVPLGKKQFWTVLFGLNLGMLLVAIDFNILATAVPTIASEFQEYNNSAWLATGFLVSLALVLPIYSKLGSIVGNGIMFNIATLLFILGSGLCGGSKSMKMLIASRVVQGLGGGGIYGLVNVRFHHCNPNLHSTLN
jgi:hypothetical protein